MLYLGIDFGTSFTKAAVFDTKMAAGNDTTKATCLVNLSDIGGKGNPAFSESIMPTVAYVETRNGKCKISVGYEAMNQRLSPNGDFYCNFKPLLDLCKGDVGYKEIHESLVVAILKYVHERANVQFNNSFSEVVLTVPASTLENGTRWNLMMSAAKAAGFTNVDIIPEPEAAAYCMLNNTIHSEHQNGKQYLIYDFGGGTFDTSVIKVCDSQVFIVDESVGSDNDRKWGGIYIDAIVRKDYINRSATAKKYADLLRGKLPKSVELDYSDHLREEPIKAKLKLSEKGTFTNSHNDYTITRADFENMREIKRMIEDTIDCSLTLLQTRSQDNLCGDIDKVSSVFLVGGSSRLPIVQSAWQSIKTDRQLNFTLTPSSLDVVACGAARYRFLKASPAKLIKEAVKKIESHDYSTAALYIGKAAKENDIAKYCLALLYYSGVLTKGKKAYRKTWDLIKDIDCPQTFELKALMTFLGHGVLKNDSRAYRYLELGGINYEGEIHKALISVMRDGDWSSLDQIYKFKAIEYIRKVKFNNKKL